MRVRSLLAVAVLLGVGAAAEVANAQSTKPMADAATTKNQIHSEAGASALSRRVPRARVSPPRAPTAERTPSTEAAGSDRDSAPRPRRRVEKHSAERTKAQSRNASDHQELETIVVVGRSERPQVVVEIQRARPRFQVGTARYSPRTKRYVRRGSQW